MKILIVGDWRWPWYEDVCAAALSAIGHEVTRLSGSGALLPGWSDDRYLGRPYPLLHRLQERLLSGPLITAFNRKLEQCITDVKPDVVWMYNCRWIYEETLARVQKIDDGPSWVLYANDDPFSSQSWPDRWRHFRRLISRCDVCLAYRKTNLEEFRRHGAHRTDLLRSYFVPSQDYPLASNDVDPEYMGDVVFTGHFEPDGRLEALEALASAGHRVRVFGGAWEPMRGRVLQGPLAGQWPINVRFHRDYRQSICGSKIALCFFSRINQDTYTRRNFQIPAMGTFMLSEYSDDLSTLFSEGVDAEFFRDHGELADKVRFYLANDAARDSIARRGLERVHRDGHDVTARMRQFVTMVGSGRTHQMSVSA